MFYPLMWQFQFADFVTPDWCSHYIPSRCGITVMTLTWLYLNMFNVLFILLHSKAYIWGNVYQWQFQCCRFGNIWLMLKYAQSRWKPVIFLSGLRFWRKSVHDLVRLYLNVVNVLLILLHSKSCMGKWLIVPVQFADLVRGGPAMNRVGLAANGYKSGELESVKFLPQTANSYGNIRFDE